MISIVTDSTSCLPCSAQAQMGALVVPIGYTVAGRSFQESYLDLNGEFEGLIAGNPGHCSTSHTSVAVFSDTFRALTQAGNEVLCLVISSRLSGTYSSASIAVRDTAPGKVAVVDSLTTAGGLALLLKEAKALSDTGASLPDVAAGVAEKRKDVGIAFTVDDMGALRESGRLGTVRQSVSAILNVRPILTLKDGVISSQGSARGRAQALRALLAQIPRHAKAVIVEHHGLRNDPSELLRMVRESFPGAEATLGGIGPSLRIHLGAGLLGAAWIT